MLESIAQVVARIVVPRVIFGPNFGPDSWLYINFIPIIWIAMRCYHASRFEECHTCKRTLVKASLFSRRKSLIQFKVQFEHVDPGFSKKTELPVLRILCHHRT